MRLSPSVDMNEVLDAVASATIQGIDPDDIIEKGQKIGSTASNSKTAKQIFADAGASTVDAAKEINRIMKFGDNDAIRLKAAETILKVQGVHQELESEVADKSPKVEINIISAQNVNLVNNLLLPND